MITEHNTMVRDAKQPPAGSKPTGEILKDWAEFGHHFQIERLREPRKVGAGVRHFRLWSNGHPALGGQWHYTQEDAERQADYLLQHSYSQRVSWLELEVNRLRKELHDTRKS